MIYQEVRFQMFWEWNDSFVVLFIHLELRKEPKEHCMKLGESKVGKFL